jgi:hypothetical protein
MSTQEFNCPSCGAPLKVENRFSKVVICVYCGQVAKIGVRGLEADGTSAALAELSSIFSVGAIGTIEGSPFKVLGFLRYEYDGGEWDEWFLQFDDGRRLWLQEDEGCFTAFEKKTLSSPVAPFKDISVGSVIPVNGASVFVTEKSNAKIVSGRGELFFTVQPGMKVQCVDGNAAGELVSLEFTTDEIHCSTGREISLGDIKISTP